MISRIYYALEEEQYFKLPQINCSGLKQMHRSPAHYQAYLEQPKKTTKAMQFGKAVHSATLEWSSFADKYQPAPEGADKRTKAGKAAHEELAANGKITLSHDDWQTIKSIADAIHSNWAASQLLRKGDPEVTVVTEIDGVGAKCRIDWYRPGVIVDLKTCEDASNRGFARACFTYDYAMQAAWYLDCCQAMDIDADTFVFIAVEKEPPYAVALYELDAASLEVGRTRYQMALDTYKQCMDSGKWPGYSQDIVSLSLPAWALRESHGN